MTDKKFTDEEIIDSLSNCALAHHNPDFCKECHYKDLGHVTCTAFIANDVIELINRQKDEIERLKEFIVETRRCDKEIKSEAVKEFADLSIKRICEQVTAPTPSESYIVERCNEEIDNLVKETVGEEE